MSTWPSRKMPISEPARLHGCASCAARGERRRNGWRLGPTREMRRPTSSLQPSARWRQPPLDPTEAVPRCGTVSRMREREDDGSGQVARRGVPHRNACGHGCSRRHIINLAQMGGSCEIAGAVGDWGA